MRTRVFLPVLALVAGHVVAQVQFTYPPAFVATTDFSTNIVMVEGEFKIIQWENVDNPNNSRISVTMFQLNGTQFLPGAEYIIQNAAPDTLSTSWTVNTAKNLTLSPMFYMNLFLEGETTSLTNSHYFNITASSTTTTSSSITTSSSSTSSSTSSQTTTTSSPATTTPATTSPAVVVSSSGLTTGAKAGIAVGVVGALFIGLLAGWLLIGRRGRNHDHQTAPGYAPPVQAVYYDPAKTELPPQTYRPEMSGEPALPVRYELPPGTQQYQ